MFLNISHRIERLTEKQWDRTVILFHFMFAFIIFSPFFLFGKFIVGGTDNHYHHFVNMIFSHRAFNQGELGLWNPYILGGVDFSASTHNFIYFPINWLIFIFPENYFFLLMTLRMFIEVWLVGVFGYLFFREELKDKKWAFFSSTVYQLNGYIFFSITTYANLTIFLFITIALYLIWTLGKRKSYLSFIYLNICLVSIILSGNIVYAFSAILVLSVLFIYRHWPYSVNLFHLSRHSIVFYTSLITGVLISMVRLLPFVFNLFFEGSRLGSGVLGGVPGYIYLGVPAFVPEVMGINIGSSFPIVFSITHQQGLHAQFHAFSYLGALPAIIVLWTAIAIRERKVNFWLIYLLITSSWLLLIQPTSDIIHSIFHPFKHPIIPKIMIPVAFCTIVGYAGKYLEVNYSDLDKRHLKTLAIIVGVVVYSCLLVYVYGRPNIINYARLAVIFISALILVGVFLYRHRPNLFNKALISFGFISVGIILILVPKTFNLMKNALFFSSFIYILTSLFGIAIFLISVLSKARNNFRKRMVLLVYFLVGILMVLVLIYPFEPMTTDMSNKGLYIIAALGMMRFILVAYFFITSLIILKAQKSRPEWLFLFFISVAILDLLPYNKVYSHQSTEPFFEGNTLYPAKGHIIRSSQVTSSAVMAESGVFKLQNLINNDSFESWSKGVNSPPDGWALGGVGPTIERDDTNKVIGRYGAAVKNNSSDIINLYQDIKSSSDLRGETFTFGVWVKTSMPNHVRLLLTDQVNGSLSGFHSGGGGWEWLTATHKVTVSSKWLRAHISVMSPGTIYTDGAILGEGHYLPPFYGYSQDAEHARSSDFHDSTPKKVEEDIDIQNFRVNNPHIVLQFSHTELATNVPAVYRIRSYGGVNSDVNRHLLKLIHYFNHSSSANSAGCYANEKDERFLGLMGCRYDAYGVIRPNALSRFMLFKDFEIVTDDQRTLAKLKEAEFNPQQKVLLSDDPGIPKGSGPGVKVDFTTFKTSEIQLEVKSDSPALLFFNDSYHEGWKVYLNGKEQPVIRANYNFMATLVQKGENKIVFRFQPRPFRYGSYLTFFWLLLFIMIGVGLYIRERGAGHPEQEFVDPDCEKVHL